MERMTVTGVEELSNEMSPDIAVGIVMVQAECSNIAHLQWVSLRALAVMAELTFESSGCP